MAAGSLIGVTSHGLFGSGGSVTCDYPAEDDVRQGVVYANGDFTGDIVLPSPDVVLSGVGYGSNGTELTGMFGVGVITPPVDGTSPFAAIAVAIKSRLVLSLGLDASWILLVANDKYRITITEPFFVYVQFYGVTQPRDSNLAYTDTGAGRLSVPVARRVRVYVYTRSGSDNYGDDTVALCGFDPSLTVAQTDLTAGGQFMAEDRVYNALVNFLPQTNAGVPLTLGPLHPLDASEEPQRKPEDEAGLLRSCLDFEIVWDMAIDPTDPALT